MSIFAAGKTSGLVVDSGHGATNIVPVCDGIPMSDAIEKMDIAGSSLNNYCKILLDEAGKNFDPTNEQAIMKAIKESQCYVAQDYWAEIESSSNKDVQYTLPDGSEITIPGKVRM